MKMSKGQKGPPNTGFCGGGHRAGHGRGSFRRRDTGSAVALGIHAPAIRFAGDGQHHLVPQLFALDHHRDHDFVAILLAIVAVKFNVKANPVPSKTTHNTLIEVAWTIIPVLILVAVAVPSFRLLFLQLDIPKADLTIKATGKQWYWSYAYPDNGKFEFDSLMVADKQPRLLGVDNEVVGAGEQDHPCADHRRRRHPFLRHPGVRHQDRRDSGPPQ